MKRRLWSCVVLVGLVVACRPGRTPEPREGETSLSPSTQPAGRATEFASREHGIRLSYPADWEAVQYSDPEYILVLVPSASEAERNNPVVSLDVPKLPPHIPGLIPLGMVVNGYADDLKKQYPGVKVNPPVSTKVAGANARRV